MNSMFGYSLFNELKEPLRSYNRMIAVRNIKQQFGNAIATDYIDELTDIDRLKIGALILNVKSKGLKATREEVMNA